MFKRRKKKKRYRFFRHRRCEFFPCHETRDTRNFNCLMCFCPLYPYPDCGGNYTFTQKGIKDCSKCTLPHYDYDYVIRKLESRK
ncbi:MAG: metal-binding protein [Clostridiales bacterium]|jgi:Zn-finger protein|nr:metal-binding protein [Clostridiales bacterium]